MMEAEKWRKYQEDYARYGIDMEPSREQESERVRKKATAKPQNNILISPRERKLMLLILVIAAFCSVSCIFISAASSQVEYKINGILEEQNVAEGEINNLKVQMMGTDSMEYIEEYATTQLGMIYPSESQYVYMSEPDEAVNSYIAGLTSQLRSGNPEILAEYSVVDEIRQGNAQLKTIING